MPVSIQQLQQPQEPVPATAAQGQADSGTSETADRPQHDGLNSCLPGEPADHAAADTLFYDGLCPLCAGEIDQLRKTRGAALQLVDIHQMSEGDDAPPKDQLLRVLHLRRADGSWLTSADANVAAWEGTLHGRLLSVLRWPLLRHLADRVYALWARWRYRRLYGSQYKDDKCN
jgi:predicted DCC family thiol-disulfide oxidoreductase YuxK